PKFTFVDVGVNQAYLIDHPMYGQLDSSSLEGVPAAALSILLDLVEYTLDGQNEFEEKRAEYRQAMDAFQRQRTRHLLRGKKASEPSTEALDSLVTLVKSMQDAIDKLVSLVFFLRDGIIDPETFDE